MINGLEIFNVEDLRAYCMYQSNCSNQQQTCDANINNNNNNNNNNIDNNNNNTTTENDAEDHDNNENNNYNNDDDMHSNYDYKDDVKNNKHHNSKKIENKKTKNNADIFDENHKTIVFFWKFFREIDVHDKKKLLQFFTGCSSIPLEGYNPPLLITDGYYMDKKSLPRAHTCFNQLVIPRYEDYNVLKEKFLFAIHNSNTFEFS
jgi:hypothetical protein